VNLVSGCSLRIGEGGGRSASASPIAACKCSRSFEPTSGTRLVVRSRRAAPAPHPTERDLRDLPSRGGTALPLAAGRGAHVAVHLGPGRDGEAVRRAGAR